METKQLYGNNLKKIDQMLVTATLVIILLVTLGMIVLIAQFIF